MKTLLILIIFFFSNAGFVYGQILIRGKVYGEKNEALPGVNVYLKNTFDGITTDSSGYFSFSTNEKIQDTLVISYLGYANQRQKIDLSSARGIELNFKLKEEANELNSVVITAGSFEASDEKKMVLLKPLDIVRTASSNGDLFGAIQTLPGAQRVGESEGLFVRGGGAWETKTLMDGLVVQNPFYSTVPDLAQRGRYSPFMFKGTSFSTGGYSAQYGQALSSVLSLETIDLEAKDQVEVFASFLTGSLTATKRWENTSLSVSGDYTHLGLAFELIPQNVEWTKPFRGQGGSFLFRHQPTKNGMLKAFGAYENTNLGINFSSQSLQPGRFGLANQVIYSNATYRDSFGKWIIQSGISYSYNIDRIGLENANVKRWDDRIQGRWVLTREIFKNSSLLFGMEAHHFTYSTALDQQSLSFTELNGAFFSETEIYLSRKLAGRVGLRMEHSRLSDEFKIAPRVSLAYKTGEFSQVSFAFGHFYQQADNRYVFLNRHLDMEKAIHYIFNYQWVKENRTFRAEAYYKNYQQLVLERNSLPFDPNPNRIPGPDADNSGFGAAKGLDVFWRDKKTLKNVDYWISYSFLDTRRLFQNYLQEATPAFASKHNLNIVYKHFLRKINLDINVTYSFASGRPYYIPNSEKFLDELTPAFHNLSLGLNYLTRIKGNQLIVVCSVSNVLGIQQVFGYRYSEDGSQRFAIRPNAYRSFFLGFLFKFE